jgi:hypothetical protein
VNNEIKEMVAQLKPKVKQKRMMQILDLDDGRFRTNH